MANTFRLVDLKYFYGYTKKIQKYKMSTYTVELRLSVFAMLTYENLYEQKVKLSA